MNHFQPRASLLVVCIGVAFGACGSDSDNEGISASVGGSGATVSAGKVDAATAQLALDELTGDVDTTVTGFSTQRPAPPTAAGTAPSNTPDGPAIAVQCNAGGSASVGGYVNVVPVPVLVDVKVSIDYQGCVTKTGTTIAGNLDFSQTVAAGAGTPLRVQTLYHGNVTMTGRVNATCPVDLNVLVDEAGKALQIEGSFCGQDASALRLQLQPRWSAD